MYVTNVKNKQTFAKGYFTNINKAMAHNFTHDELFFQECFMETVLTNKN